MGRDSCVTRQPRAGRWWWWWEWWPSQYAVSTPVIFLLSRYRHPPPHFSPDIEFFCHTQPSQPSPSLSRWKPVSPSFGDRQKMLEMLTNRMLIEDISWCCHLLGPALVLSCGQMAGVLWTSVKTKTCHSVFSSLTHRLSWDRQTGRQAGRRPQISERITQEIICSRGYALRLAFYSPSRLCARNLWFRIRLRVMTVTWTNQIWQKIISWPSFDLKILKTGIISMLGARLVHR